MKDIRSRWFEQNLASALRVLPVTVLTGARQTGKTTLVRNLANERLYLTLDDTGVLHQSEHLPESLLTKRPVTFDEIQRAPALLLALKRAVDDQRRPGDFLVTSSANLLLIDRVADTLAGRAVYLELPPFCPAEWTQRPEALSPIDALFEADFDPDQWPQGVGDWKAWLVRGGFPPALAIANDEDRALWFSAHIQTYLERDLRQLSAVSSLADFQRLMVLSAHRTARLLNQADLARDAGLSHPTTHRYLNLLETGCLVSRLRPLTTNPSLALVKTPKLYWSDCGLAAALAGIHSPDQAASRPDAGYWLEQTLFQTLQTWRALKPLQRRLHFWRDRAGREVDFVLEENEKLVALEIKNASQITEQDAAGIQAFRASLRKGQRLVRSVVLHAGQARILAPGVVALPWAWWVPRTRD